MSIVMTVNGRRHEVAVDPDTPLLYVLRNDLGLTGARFGCGLGLCGACDVLVDGRPVHSCDTPLWSVDGHEVTTVEALGRPDEPGPLQQALLDAQAPQCAFCVSGILMVATALLRDRPDAGEAEIRTALDGNLCRCGSHNRIVRALAGRPSKLEPSGPARPSVPEGLPTALRSGPPLSAWVTFDPPGAVTVRVGKVEIGQGILTALTQLVADELVVDPGRVSLAGISTIDSPDEGYTAGSRSVEESGWVLRVVCGQLRRRAVTAAAHRLGVPEPEVELADGTFSAPAGRVTYWELPNDDLFDPSLSYEPPAAGPGAVAPRVDLAEKIAGGKRYLADRQPPGLLHARVVRPPRPGAHLRDIERDLPGVHRVIVDGDFVAVLAEREETAVSAASRLAAGATWTDGVGLQADLREPLRGAGRTETVELLHTGQFQPTRRATFGRGALAHASIGTSTGLAVLRAGELTVWTHSQGVYPLRAALARALGRDEASIVVHHREHAGCYGHNGADDAAYDAAYLALQVPDRPVRVAWSRPEELAWAPFGAPMEVDVSAELAPDGTIVGWGQEVRSYGHVSRPGAMREPAFLSYWHQHPDQPVPDAGDAGGQASGRNAVPGYDIPAMVVRSHRLTDAPIRTSTLRSLGAQVNVFAAESFVDELAAGVGRDPVEYRLAHLSDERGRAVLTTAARRAGWSTPLGDDRARGVGYARYKNNSGYCAAVAEVELAAGGSLVHVRRLTIAVDVGYVLSHDGVVNQIEGGAIQAVSWTTLEEVRTGADGITSDTWATYPIIRFTQVPAVEVEVLDSAEPSLGAGEIATGPTTAAVANAIAALVGVRVRQLPITSEAIAAAINGAD